MDYDIFISYSSLDQEIAEDICSYFEKNGLSCWIAPRNVRAGENYAEEIMLGLDSAKIVVLIFSQNSQSSKYVIKEVQKAFINNKGILPINIDDSLPKGKMETFLRNKQWLNAFPNPEESYDDMVDGARRLIKGQRPGGGFVQVPGNDNEGSFFDKHKYHLIAVAAIILIAVVGFVAFGGTGMNSNGSGSSQPLVSIDYIQMDDDSSKGYSWKYSYFVFGSLSSNVSDSSNVVHVDFLDDSGKVVMSNDTKVKDIEGNTLGIGYSNNNNVAKVSLELKDKQGKVLASAQSSNFVNQ